MSNEFWALIGACVIGGLLALGTEKDAGAKIERVGMSAAALFVIVILALAGVGLWAAMELKAAGFDVFTLAAQGGVR